MGGRRARPIGPGFRDPTPVGAPPDRRRQQLEQAARYAEELHRALLEGDPRGALIADLLLHTLTDLMATPDVAPAVPDVEAQAGPAVSGKDELPHLTPREHQVLAHIVAGLRNKEIASRLGVTPKTVMHHSASIYRKLGVRGRAEAAVLAVRDGFVRAEDTS